MAFTLGDHLARAAAAAPDAVAYVEGDRRLTYAEWDRLSDRAAARLWALGLRPGDVVALRLPQTCAYPIAYLGAAKAGLVTAGVNMRLGEREVAHILETSGASILVGDGDHPRVLSTGEITQAPPEPPEVRLPPDHPVAIVYTSGTTGLPKGATFTMRALEAVRRIEATFEPSGRPVGLASTPLAHVGYMTKIVSSFDRLTTTVLMDRWTARAALETIQRERLTHVGGIPTQLTLMLMDQEFGRFDLSSLRSCMIGGAPASPELVRRIREGFGVPVLVRYSCTELGMACGTRPGDPDEVVAETVGLPMPGIDLRLVGVGGDGVGEITVRSPTMMSGYWRDPEGTRAAIDEHGFFHTGDLGRVRTDGNLVLAGRSKEMYIRGGYNVYPVEVENVLREHPKVGLAAVIGVPDEVLGERGLALVVPRSPDDPPEPDDLRAFVAARIADYKVPDFFELREGLPLNATFKVDKAALLAALRDRPQA